MAFSFRCPCRSGINLNEGTYTGYLLVIELLINSELKTAS